ncbi:hypothetical protein JHK86_034980 [Glycine max]|nr:hypothetical protein JHK86_034980 [Glycine max]
MDECGRQMRVQKCGQCGGSGHNKRSCTNRPRNANASFGGSLTSTVKTCLLLVAANLADGCVYRGLLKNTWKFVFLLGATKLMTTVS